MIDFWLAIGLMLLVAMSFLLLPVVRERRAQSEEDRTALNVALYQERLDELQGQAATGLLSAAQMDTARAEAGRELLADTDGIALRPVRRLGKALPFCVALLVPLLGLGLYLHWGASDKVELSREFAVAPHSLAEMTARLERAAAAQPDSAEGWYFLGRSYMAENRFSDARQAFQRSLKIAGRQPELLGQLAQAIYFGNGRKWSADIQAITDEALAGDPNEATSLGLLGVAAFEAKRYQDAVIYWQRLLAILPANDASRQALQGGIDKARANLGTSAPAAPVANAQLKVHVVLADALKGKVQPSDSVFIFARAVSGPPMPLAVKRMTVADLPADVVLSDSDAMLPQLKLSAFAQVQLMARVSRAGTPTAGEWLARGNPLSSQTSTVQTLVIDSPDQP